MKGEEKLLKKLHNRNVAAEQKKSAYQFPEPGSEKLEHRPVIVGTGPAGLFCGLDAGPSGIPTHPSGAGRGPRERGRETVDRFWNGGAP